jgi:hypothetical protein
MTAAEFKPAFRTDVGVVWAGDPATANGVPTFTPVNPSYCATDQCAKDFMAVFADLGAKLVKDSPFPGWPTSNAFYQTAQVPYMEFPDGTKINIGLEASFFTHGYPPAYAEAAVRNDIRLTIG